MSTAANKEKYVLVLIDCKTHMAKRFSGRTAVLKIQSDRPWTAEDVEKLRVKPELLMADIDPEAA